MRIYDPRLGRFLSVDPLTGKFAYYTPYQFSGNSPIKFIDMDGLEPANPDQAEYKGKTGAVDFPYKVTGGDQAYQKNFNILIGKDVAVDNTKFFANSKNDRFMRFVNTDSQFLVTDESKINSQTDLVNKLVGDFVWGKGHENVVFPHNGKVSSYLKSSISVGSTLLDWVSKGYPSNYTSGWSMNSEGQVNVLVNSGPKSLEQFLGSVAVRISQVDAEKIKVEIFNVTSMTSGYLAKDIPLIGRFFSTPVSTPRFNKQMSSLNKNYQSTYSNISQYFSFDLSTSEANKIITQFAGGQNPYPRK